MQASHLTFSSNMLLWHYSLFLLWETTSVFAVNPAKINPKILEKWWIYNRDNVFVSFGSTQRALEFAKHPAGSSSLSQIAGYIRSSLIDLAKTEQAGVINLLSSRNKYEFESMWLSNRIFIKEPDLEIFKEISDMANVTYIKEEEYTWVLVESQRPDGELYYPLPAFKTHQNNSKGIEIIQAPEAWKVLGGSSKAGEGIVVGVLDSGAYAGHETLIENFVGMNYGYFDGEQEPVKEAVAMTHGTHVTGTIVGRKGIGVAPAAKHSQCRACTRKHCWEKAFEKCIAFFICPTLQDGTQPDCSRRVNIIHMSVFGFSPTMKPILDAAISAGILLVAPMVVKWSAPERCKMGLYPGLFDEVIAVGVANLTGHLEDAWPRGPFHYTPKPKGNRKPDLVAPGVDIVSAHYKDPEYKYLTMTGALTATAHVTGVVALLLTRDKTLTQGQVRKLIIENTDRPLRNTWDCVNGTLDTWPNPEFGYGRINALKVLNAQTVMLFGPQNNNSDLVNTCQQSFDDYKQRLNEKTGNINSLNIEIGKELQRSGEDFDRIAHEVFVFNATLKNLVTKAKQFENSLKAVENH